ncbi:MAG TPA: OmpA family protein, partial [Chitinophagaceae bacterium]|nr:OmpA family protein [Chitinophagaceae bacterium]
TVKTSDNTKVMKWWDRETRPNFKNDVVLPDQFTIEFDLYFEGPPRTGYGYKINFYRKGSAAIQNFIDIGYWAMRVAGLDERVPDKKKEDFYNTWHHISLSYNKGSVKGYFDQYRLFNARLKMDDNERTDYIAFYNCCTSKENGHIFLIDNVRFAEGAHAKYKEEILEGGKIVTNNIHFGYNSSQLLPHSYAEIKRIADVMKENPDMKFSIDGYTDSDGSDDYNLKLSKERADAVKRALVDMEISESRLSTTGMGEAAPVAENSTPEGKAMNRRVEFVKKA